MCKLSCWKKIQLKKGDTSLPPSHPQSLPASMIWPLPQWQKVLSRFCRNLVQMKQSSTSGTTVSSTACFVVLCCSLRKETLFLYWQPFLTTGFIRMLQMVRSSQIYGRKTSWQGDVFLDPTMASNSQGREWKNKQVFNTTVLQPWFHTKLKTVFTVQRVWGVFCENRSLSAFISSKGFTKC